MKRILLIILPIFLGTPIFAQDVNWFPIGAEWYFTPQCFFEPQCGVVRYHVESDTLITGKTAKKIIKEENIWGPIIGSMTFDVHYLRHENDTVYRYSFEADKWHFLYCVNPQPGDVWEIQSDEYFGLGYHEGHTFVVEVDAVVFEEIGGINRRIVHTSPVGESDILFHRTLIEGIGSTESTGLIGSYTVMQPAGFGPTFNCYLESGNLIYGSPASPCFSVGIDDLISIQISVQPNPTKDQITIQIAEGSFPNEATITLYDLNGRQLLNTALTPGNNTHIVDLRHFTSGMYLLQCVTPSQILWTGKVVKN
jgi:hypothetical protein